MDSNEVRRVYLRHGGSLTLAAHELGITKQLVDYHVRKANRDNPLTYHQGPPEDQRAMAAYVRAALDKVKIAHD